ncbi:DNA polymerase I [Sedimentisphaera cyanobacteriorum]|uniref:DNA polymerase I n=1 Tax=Sedimentisphaera cyanobacteriorum TaxID=1940790 RepID=A0A1Q2HQF7_9BACT|nr:DNA polymerase I [Sedimentisphaera cyanobacteriorum]AQQ09473.1 DNA polymerase I [Sedimentisphaera cyanobacteriorum]
MPEKFYLIDGHALIYSSYFAPMRTNLSSPSGEPTKASYIFTTTLLGLINRKNPDMLAVAMDSREKSFRSDIFPEYKAQRPPMPEDMPQQIERIEQILEAMKIPVLRVKKYEADDIIGTLSEKASKEGLQTYICSGDKDMLQLIEKNVFVYDIKKDSVKDLNWLETEKQLTPEQFLDALALMGDTADNIPGVPDVGPKTAEQWIRKYGSLEKLYENAGEIKGKRGNSLRDSKEEAKLSRELVEIKRDCPVELRKQAFRLSDFDYDRLAEIFYELGFQRLYKTVGLEGKLEEIKTETKTEGKGKKKQTALFDNESEYESMKDGRQNYRLVGSEEELEELCGKLEKQTIFAIDTETSSIEPMKAELVGVSISWKQNEAYYIPVKAGGNAKTISTDKLKEKLGGILRNPNIKKAGQNVKYDIEVLWNSGLSLEGVSFDTMIASYLLNAERSSNSMDAMAKDYLNYECQPISDLIGKGKSQITFDKVPAEDAADYACEDADITFRLYEYLNQRLNQQPKLMKLFEELEMPLMKVLCRMEIEGVSIDCSVLEKMSREISSQIETLRDSIFAQTGSVFNIESPKQLSEVLFDKLKLPQIKKRSTDASVLEKLADFHPVIEDVQQFRQLVKLKGTYIDKLGAMVNPKTNRLHCSFNQTITATGRLSSSNPNLQNIPIRTDIGRKIRAAFVPGEKDGVILSADYSQVELRLLAHFSQDSQLLEAFNSDMDIHSFVASELLGADTENPEPELRAKAKAVNFGIIYGQGPYALSQSLGITQSEAKEFIDSYFHRYSSIKDFMQSVIDGAKTNGYVSTILGRRRAVPGINSSAKREKSSAERMAFNTTIQGSAADLIKAAMIEVQNQIDAEKLKAKMIIQIHDELVFECSRDDAEQNAKLISEIMENAIELRVRLKVDTGWGENWMTGH